MSEHSKGPWTYDAKTGKIRDAAGVAIADDMAFGGPAETPTYSNMLLMASAPELVDVVLRLLVGVGASVNGTLHAAYHTEADVQAARAAIEKAGVKP